MVVFCLYKPHIWKLTSLILPKEKGILEKNCCYDFLQCVSAWSFEIMGQIPAITSVRKAQKTAVSVKIPVFFPTLLTKQLLADTNHACIWINLLTERTIEFQKSNTDRDW